MDVIYPLKEIKRCKTGGKPIKRGGNMRHNFAKKQKKRIFVRYNPSQSKKYQINQWQH